MKKQIIIALCTISSLNCMEQPYITRKSAFRNLDDIKPQRKPREWDAQTYDKSCTTQTEAFLQFLATNKINITNKTVIDVGCGTGKIASKLATRAALIHGFDASKNMIELAQKNFNTIKNLSFEHCFAEDFISPKLYQIAIASHAINWFEDKKQAFQRINDILEENGDLFANVQTKETPKPLNLITAQEKTETINKLYKRIAGQNLIDISTNSYPSDKELETLLKETGFEILKYEEQSFFSIMTKEEIIEKERPLMFDKPITQYIPDIIMEPFFNDYIKHYLSKLIQVTEEQYLEETTTTIVHARKIKK